MVLPPEAPLNGYFELPMLTFTASIGKPRVSANTTRSDGSCTGAQVLRTTERLDTAVGMNLQQAVRVVGGSAQLWIADPQAIDHGPFLGPLAVRMPLLSQSISSAPIRISSRETPRLCSGARSSVPKFS